jgi:choline dehydrogenase-like flavoprotein
MDGAPSEGCSTTTILAQLSIEPDAGAGAVHTITFAPEEWIARAEGLPPHFLDIGHPTGTTRMAIDRNSGVVDPNCEVHGTSGLFVAGSSVFPTAGRANPTQMIVALAIRVADTLKRRSMNGGKR